MSTTIGIGYISENGDLFDSLKDLASNFNYGLLNGLGYAEKDMQSGLKDALKCEKWEHLHFLQSPRDRDVALAFEIQQELYNYEKSGEKPPFFDFLNSLVHLGKKHEFQKLGVFFSGEWYEGDHIRYGYGKISDLISQLSMPGYWQVRYLNPVTCRLQDSDETPFIFDVLLPDSHGASRKGF